MSFIWKSNDNRRIQDVLLTWCLLPDRLSWLHIIKAVFSVIFSKTTNLFPLCLEVQLLLWTWRLAHPTSLVQLRRPHHRSLRGITIAVTRLCTLSNSALIHGLEGVVSRHTSVVQVRLFANGHSSLGYGSITIALGHVSFFSSNLFLLKLSLYAWRFQSQIRIKFKGLFNHLIA